MTVETQHPGRCAHGLPRLGLVRVWSCITGSTWRSRVAITRPELYLSPKYALGNSTSGLITGLLLQFWAGCKCRRKRILDKEQAVWSPKAPCSRMGYTWALTGLPYHDCGVYAYIQRHAAFGVYVGLVLPVCLMGSGWRTQRLNSESLLLPSDSRHAVQVGQTSIACTGVQELL